MRLPKNWYNNHKEEILDVYKENDENLYKVLDYLSFEYDVYPDENFIREKIKEWLEWR